MRPADDPQICLRDGGGRAHSRTALLPAWPKYLLSPLTHRDSSTRQIEHPHGRKFAEPDTSPLSYLSGYSSGLGPPLG